MKAFSLFLFLLLGSYGATAQAGYAWVNQLSSSANEARANAVATDAAGNSYVTGSFSGTARWGTIVLTSRGQSDLYVAKYSPAGKPQWVSQIGGDPNPERNSRTTASGTGISLDARGNVYLTGGFTGTITDDSGGLLTSFNDAFVTALIARFDGRGRVQWTQRFGIPQFGCYANRIATDAAGNSYVVGQSDYGGIQFGDLVVGDSRRVLFVARYTATGAVSWAHVSSNYTTYGASASAVVLDKRGNCLIGGFFNHDMVLAGASLTTVSSDCYIASFRATTGALQWIKQGGGSGEKSLRALALDRAGNIYAAGQHGENTSLDGTPLATYGGNSDLFLARYTSAGRLQWVRTMGTSASEYPLGLATEADGTSTLLSSFYPPQGSSQPQQTLLQTFRPDGSDLASETLGTTGSCMVRDIAGSAQAGQAVLVGNLNGSAQFGATNLQTTVGTSGFVARRQLHTAPPVVVGNGGPTLDVSPNPVRGQLTARLSWSNPGMLLPGRATLFTFMGKAVATQPLVATGAAQSQVSFDCSALPTGLYVLRLLTTDGMTYAQGIAVQ